MGQSKTKNNDKIFEEYLGEFQPQKPRALPESIVNRQVWPRRLAAAAVMAIAFGASLWSLRQKSASQDAGSAANSRSGAGVTRAAPRAPSIVVLTRLALENPQGVEAVLNAAHENQLPRFDREGSALRILAKE